jgi:hypothetical protein
MTNTFFLQSGDREYLRKYTPPVAEYLGDVCWPPKGYPEARDDEAFLRRLSQALGPAYESSSKDTRYMAFVAPPGVEPPGESEALDRRIESRLAEASELIGELNDVLAGLGEEGVGEFDPEAEADDLNEEEEDDDEVEETLADEHPEWVMLGMAPKEIAEAIRDNGEEWWREWWDEPEYKARLEAGALMARELSNVEHWVLELDDGWGIAYYQGTSKSGATVGVLAARYDADFDGEEDFEDEEDFDEEP